MRLHSGYAAGYRYPWQRTQADNLGRWVAPDEMPCRPWKSATNERPALLGKIERALYVRMVVKGRGKNDSSRRLGYRSVGSEGFDVDTIRHYLNIFVRKQRAQQSLLAFAGYQHEIRAATKGYF